MEVKIGKIYRHFKGGKYKVLAVSRDCENPENLDVIYEMLYSTEDFPKGTVWKRNLSDFEGEKEFKDGKKVKRFELQTLNDSNYKKNKKLY